MKVVASTTNGFLVEATNEEIVAIVRAVSGNIPKEGIAIGQKIPAIDYASTIARVKNLGESYEFTGLSRSVALFSGEFEKLRASVELASSIDLK